MCVWGGDQKSSILIQPPTYDRLDKLIETFFIMGQELQELRIYVLSNYIVTTS